VRFGIFEADLQTGELRRNGSRVRLQEQPFQILTALLERPGGVVTRQELRERLWPADTFVDFDHSLNTAIRRLRDALGDNAENPRFVETVARRGYRFLVPINGEVAVAPTPHPVPAPRKSHWQWLLAGAAIPILCAVTVWHFQHAFFPRPSTISRRLTANAPELPVTDGVISPDGRYLAFADASGFYLRQIDSGETNALQLPPGFNAKPASWFPDGTHVLATWIAGPQEPPSIWEVSTIGGNPKKLRDEGTHPTVSPDGKQIAFLSGQSSNQIWVMDANGSNAHQVLDGGQYMLSRPAWGPDSHRLAYVRGKYTPAMFGVEGKLEILDLRGGKSTSLFTSPTILSTLAWAPDGRLIYSLFEPSPNQGDANLWELLIDSSSRARGAATRITSANGLAAYPSITADGKRLAYFRETIEPDVYVADVDASGTRITEPKRLTLDERADLPYAWTPDNKAVIFVSNRNGSYNIFKQRADQIEPEALVRGNDQMIVPRLDPNGVNVLYLVAPPIGTPASNVGYLIPPPVGSPSSKVRLMRSPLAGGPPQLVLEAEGINNQQCARSPSEVCVLSRLEPGRERLFRFDPAKGLGAEIPQAEVRSSDALDFNWTLSPDGKMLAMAKKEGIQKEPEIRLLSIDDGTVHTIPVPGYAGVSSLDWAADGRSLWVMTYFSNATKALLRIKTTGTSKVILNEAARPILLEGKMTLGWAIPSNDGKHLALWKANGSSNVWMLENF